MIRKTKKMARVKQERIKRWEAMMARPVNDSAKQLRMKTGGYRCPGSNKRT